jgi:hypothetical protein
MHWFDRLSRRIAEPPPDGLEVQDPPTGSTRRNVLKGATIAALAFPLAPEALGRQAVAAAAGTATRSDDVARMPPELQPRETISEFCDKCMQRSYGKHDYLWSKCGPSANTKPFLKPKGGKGKSTKTTPGKAAKQLACQAKVLKSLDKELQACRIHFCEGDSEPAIPPPSGATGGESSTCPGGTSKCTETLCCYGGDACCLCASTGDFICCAGVIGCTCC